MGKAPVGPQHAVCFAQDHVEVICMAAYRFGFYKIWYGRWDSNPHGTKAFGF